MRKTIWILAAILVFALSIRLYHLNFPAIGYHNMKENVFISMARNMERSGNYFHRQVDFQNWGIGPMDISGGYITAWQTVLCSKLFGPALFLGVARLVNVVFFLCALLPAFRISMELTRSVSLGVLAVLIMAVLPLGNYFSRNLQPESACFLAMLVLIDCGLRFDTTQRRRYLWIAGLTSAVILLGKYTFLVGGIPLLFSVSFGRLFKRLKLLNILGSLLLCALPLLITAVVFRNDAGCQGCGGRVDYFRIFSGGYWKDSGPILFSYAVRENFTWFYVIAGTLGAVWIFLRAPDQRLKRFILGWLIALVLYGMALSDYINQHNYYQMPFLFLVAFCSAYFLWHAGLMINRILKSHAGYILIAGFLLISLPDVYAATMRQYDYVLFGQDVAGGYLKKHVPEGKPFFHYTWSQGYGVCTYADRRCGWPSDLDDFKRKETALGIEYVSVYPTTYLQTMSQDLRQYIAAHYHVVHVGFIEEAPNVLMPEHLILKKGGSVDVEGFLKGRTLRQARIYKMLRESVPYMVAEG